MTTKPKARRFRLRLNDETGAALRPSVAPQRADRPAQAEPRRAAQPTAPQAATPSRAAPAAQEPPQARGQTAAVAPSADGDALFDEAAPPARPARPQASDAQSGAAQTPRPVAADKTTEGAPATGGLRQPGATGEHAADVTGAAGTEAEIEAIRAEGLTGRQLRMAMRVAQRNGIRATSGLEAVRLLRRQGIDPFEPSTLLDIVRDQTRASTSRALTTTDQPKLPKAYRQPPPPAPARPDLSEAEAARKLEVSRIQRDIIRRRRRRMALLAARLLVFVGLPTLITAYYFFAIATPLYATNSEFVIQQADTAPSAGTGLAGMLSGGGVMGPVQDSVTVQSYLQSREAMRRLDAEEGFKAYFQSPAIDPLRRLAPDSTDEAAYRLYEDMVRVSFDPTEGIIRMEVIAADPETSERFARALLRFAEEQVDQLTLRLRENQMRDAMQSVAMAEARFNEAQLRVLELQERFRVLSSEVEVSLLTQQITNLETQLNQERLSLSDLQANPRPNRARLEQVQRRIAALEAQIADLRASLTDGGESGTSLARVQRELVMAESEVATRQMLLAQAMQQQEAARIEANRQVRYLSLGVPPTAPDEATYPRTFENTALAFLVFGGIYLMVSMTSAILREQVTG
ncbi:MAG: capsule polysaccharide transporter [Pararhodobacter sp.]